MTKHLELLPVALLLAACLTTSEVDESRNYSRLGEHERAFQLLDEVREQRIRSGAGVDEAFEREHAAARARFLLERARQRIFLEREDDALADLASVLAIDPEHAEAQVLRQRAYRKKAMHATEDGDEHLFKNELEQALVCYLEAGRYVPGYGPAADGEQKVRVAVSRLTAHAQQQFLEAVRKLPEFRFHEVRWHSDNAVVNDKSRQDAAALKQRANREIARKTFERGQACQAKDQFGAALVEYRTAKKLDESLAGVDEAIAQMQRELEAGGLVDRATMLMRLSRFAEARENLTRAHEMSLMTRGTITELLIESRRREGERDFTACHDLEILGRKREALAAFEALVQKWPDGIADEKARIEGLRADIDGAAREWEAGEAAEGKNDLPGAIEHFRASFQYYADFRNAKERIAQLQARIAGSSGS
ncbi:MAG: hypothetical protein FJ265_02515 [Planctomycetes bacterium]|nr:hypothetical protein [Planctomycetota bacterium]